MHTCYRCGAAIEGPAIWQIPSHLLDGLDGEQMSPDEARRIGAAVGVSFEEPYHSTCLGAAGM